MGLFKFFKEAGERLFNHDHDEEKKATAIKDYVQKQGLNIEGMDVKVNGDKVNITGKAPSQEAMEKAVLAAGNVTGVGEVHADIHTAAATGAQTAVKAPEPKFYAVKSGDTLSKIAKEQYGDANRYQEIFEANKPMLTSPDKIYPGQNLRIPQKEMAEA